MDIDPMELAENDEENSNDRDKRRLNTWVAVSVALLATFLGVCNVKDDNIVQGMQQAQADKLDHWNFYQARNLREEMATIAADQMRLQAASQPAGRQATYQAEADKYQKLADEQNQKKKALQAQAEADQKTYDALNVHDDQFDLCSALIAIAISMLAVTSLTQKRWLYGLALMPSFFGALMGLAGLFGWSLHPSMLTRLLSCIGLL
jgi:hypothetical protein